MLFFVLHCTTFELRLPDDGGNKGPDRSCLLGKFEIRGELMVKASEPVGGCGKAQECHRTCKGDTRQKLVSVAGTKEISM